MQRITTTLVLAALAVVSVFATAGGAADAPLPQPMPPYAAVPVLHATMHGRGFFAVRNGALHEYTKGGLFIVSGGYLVAPGGGRVLGWPTDAQGHINTNAAPQPMRLVNMSHVGVWPHGGLVATTSFGHKFLMGELAVATFANGSGLGTAAAGVLLATADSGAAQLGQAGQGGRGTINAH